MIPNNIIDIHMFFYVTTDYDIHMKVFYGLEWNKSTKQFKVRKSAEPTEIKPSL